MEFSLGVLKETFEKKLIEIVGKDATKVSLFKSGQPPRSRVEDIFDIADLNCNHIMLTGDLKYNDAALRQLEVCVRPYGAVSVRVTSQMFVVAFPYLVEGQEDEKDRMLYFMADLLTPVIADSSSSVGFGRTSGLVPFDRGSIKIIRSQTRVRFI
jgi:hypothetical protein